MSIATATFWGDSLDNYGMPYPFFRYFLVEDTAEHIGKGVRIVSITALTSPGPMPSSNETVFIVKNASSDEAINKAFEILSSHTQIKNLRKQLAIQSTAV